MCTLIVMKKHKAYLQFNCQLFLFLINRRVIIREINQHKVLDNTFIQLSEFYLKRPSCLQISKGRLPTRGGMFYHVSVILNCWLLNKYSYLPKDTFINWLWSSQVTACRLVVHTFPPRASNLSLLIQIWYLRYPLALALLQNLTKSLARCTIASVVSSHTSYRRQEKQQAVYNGGG